MSAGTAALTSHPLFDAPIQMHHVAVGVASLKETTAWYAAKLGWPCVREFGHPVRPVTFALVQAPGGVILEFVERPGSAPNPAAHGGPSEGSKVQGFFHLAFTVESCDQAVAELKRRGVDVVGSPSDSPEAGMRCAFFHDSDGNLFELVEMLK